MKKLIPFIPDLPSETVTLMCDALEEYGNSDDFIVNMGSFGGKILTHYSGEQIGVVNGCAATCYIQKLTGVNLSAYADSSEHVHFNWKCAIAKKMDAVMGRDEAFCAVNTLEFSIDLLRKGSAQWCHTLYRENTCQEGPLPIPHPAGWSMDSRNWREELPKAREYAAELKAGGW